MGLPLPSQDVLDEVIDVRRHLHRNPEVSWDEHRTTATLVTALRREGLDPQVAGTGTGVVCDIGSDGPLVAIRGDIVTDPVMNLNIITPQNAAAIETIDQAKVARVTAKIMPPSMMNRQQPNEPPAPAPQSSEPAPATQASSESR